MIEVKQKRNLSGIILVVIAILMLPMSFGCSQSTDSIDETPLNLEGVVVGDHIQLGEFSFDTHKPTSGWNYAIPTRNSDNFVWEVLNIENGQALVISRDVIAFERYHGLFTNVTWETSDIRKWLNNDFYKSLPKNVQNRIVETSLKNRNDPNNSNWSGNNTADKVFLISFSAAYGYSQTYGTGSLSLTSKINVADYAVSDGYQWGWWWLRDVGRRSDYASYIHMSGTISGGSVSDFGGVRPAFWISLSDFGNSVNSTQPTQLPVEEEQPTTITTTYTGDAVDVLYSNKSMDITYDSAYFTKSSAEYNHELAKFALGLCATTYSGTTEESYSKLGFSEYRSYELEDSFFPNDTIKAQMAKKALADGTELISITLSGTQAEEWQQYLNYFAMMVNYVHDKSVEAADTIAPGASELDTMIEDFARQSGIPDPKDFYDNNGLSFDDSKGIFENFLLARVSLHAMLLDYCGNDLSNKKFLLTGHSRGAAVSNLEAGLLNSIVGQENVYSYTFATPNTHLPGGTPPEANNIYNIVDAIDIVSQVPPFGSKAGHTYGYNTLAGSLLNLTGINKAFPGVVQHSPGNYMDLMTNGAPSEQFSYPAWSWTSIHCPTDLKVFNQQGQLVASITDNVVSEDNKYLILTTDEGEKTVILPKNESFVIEVVATADGSMTYSQETLSGGRLSEEIQAESVDLKQGDMYVVNLTIDDPMQGLMTRDEYIEGRLSRGPGFDAFTIFAIISSLVLVAAIVVASVSIFGKKRSVT